MRTRVGAGGGYKIPKILQTSFLNGALFYLDCVTGALLPRTTPPSYNSFLIWRSERGGGRGGGGNGHPILDVPSVLRLPLRGDMVLQVVIVVPFPEPELH